MSRITFALPKGRLLAPALDLLDAVGIDTGGARTDSRKLIFDDLRSGVRLLLLKPVDVLTFVEHGAADLGIVGQDVLREREGDVFEPMTLPFGHCRLVLAGRPERAQTDWRLAPSLRIATQYPQLTRRFFSERGWSAEIITLNGSAEIAPALGLADLLVDLVDTGRTLRENGLVEFEELRKSQAVLIVNRASHTLRAQEIGSMTARLQQACNRRELNETGTD